MVAAGCKLLAEIELTRRLKDRLTMRAAQAASPHVRRITPMIGMVFDGLARLGAEIAPHRERQVVITLGERELLGRYEHPIPDSRGPRRAGRLAIYERAGRSVGRLVATFATEEEAWSFRQRPRLP